MPLFLPGNRINQRFRESTHWARKGSAFSVKELAHLFEISAKRLWVYLREFDFPVAAVEQDKERTPGNHLKLGADIRVVDPLWDNRTSEQKKHTVRTVVVLSEDAATLAEILGKGQDLRQWISPDADVLRSTWAPEGLVLFPELPNLIRRRLTSGQIVGHYDVEDR